jgi:hypothetical protein
MLNIDFALAATYQDGWSGLVSRATKPLNYCDKNYTLLSTVGAEYLLQTRHGLTGTTKCTYFIKAGNNAGAPAFSITKLDYWKF